MELEELKELISEKLRIDPVELDNEAIRTPQLYGEFLNLYSNESLTLKRMSSQYRALKLERYKYYINRQPPEYYVKYPLNEKPMKTEVPMYLEADPVLAKLDELLEEQKIKVKMIEDAMKQIANRSFQIRDAIEWRKFTNGG